jgi:hypothetical protein
MFHSVLAARDDEIAALAVENLELRRALVTTRWALVWSQSEPQLGEKRWWQ